MEKVNLGNFIYDGLEDNEYLNEIYSLLLDSYLAKTRIKVISHYSNTVDYIYVPKTGRYAYCKVSAFK